MPQIFYTAKFSPTESPDQILEDLACPACGRRDPTRAYNRISDNKLRTFCEGCGAFTTVLLNDEQVRALQRGGIKEWAPR